MMGMLINCDPVSSDATWSLMRRSMDLISNTLQQMLNKQLQRWSITSDIAKETL